MERIDRKALTIRALKKFGIGFAIIEGSSLRHENTAPAYLNL